MPDLRDRVVKEDSARRADHDKLGPIVFDTKRSDRAGIHVDLAVLTIEMMGRAAKDNKRSMLVFEKLLLQNGLGLYHSRSSGGPGVEALVQKSDRWR